MKQLTDEVKEILKRIIKIEDFDDLSWIDDGEYSRLKKNKLKEIFDSFILIHVSQPECNKGYFMLDKKKYCGKWR